MRIGTTEMMTLIQQKHDALAAYELNHSQLTFRARSDWTNFTVTLHRPSQFRHLQTRVAKLWGKIYFRAVAGTGGRTWAFRLQDPPGPEQFMREVQAMVRPGDPRLREEDIRILGTEIALDVYHATNDRLALTHVVLHCLRHQARPLAGCVRITHKRKRVDALYPCEVFDAVSAGNATIRTGPIDGDHTCRFYLKDYDTVDGVPYAPIAPERWRARYENTLTGEAVPFRTVKEWRDFKFESMAKDMFAMLMPSPTRSPLVAMMQARMVQLGRRPDSYKRRPSDRRQRTVSMRRDSFTNDRIRQALRALTSAQSCRNSVAPLPKLNCSPLERLPEPGLRPEYIDKSLVTKWCHGTVWKEQRGPPHCRRRDQSQQSHPDTPSNPQATGRKK